MQIILKQNVKSQSQKQDGWLNVPTQPYCDEKVQVGKDQERRNQNNANPTCKTEEGKQNTKLTIRYLYHENIS